MSQDKKIDENVSKSLADSLLAMSKLMVRMNLFEKDKIIENGSEWQTFYAIDTPIFMEYAGSYHIQEQQQTKNGIISKNIRVNSSGNVFPNIGADIENDLAKALSNHCVKRLSKQCFILPGHSKEILSRTSEMISQGVNQIESFRNKIEHLIQGLDNENPDFNKYAQKCSDVLSKSEAPIILSSILIGELFAKNILNFTSYINEYIDVSGNLSIGCSQMRLLDSKLKMLSAHDKRIFSDIKNRWSDHIWGYRESVNHNSSSNSTNSDVEGKLSRYNPAINRDIESLAYLEFINSVLHPFKIRLLFITNSELLITSAHFYFPDFLSNASDEDELLSFSELYIRHPQAYIADPNCLFKDKSRQIESIISKGNSAAENDTPIDMYVRSLPSIYLGQFKTLNSLKKIYRSTAKVTEQKKLTALKSSNILRLELLKEIKNKFRKRDERVIQDIISEFANKWIDVIKATDYLTDIDDIQKVLRTDLNKASKAQLSNNLQRLKTWCDNELDRAWSLFFRLVSTGSAELSYVFFNNSEEWIIRRVQPLLFDENVKLTIFLKDIIDGKTNVIKQLNMLEKEIWLGNSNIELVQYERYLVYASVFCLLNNWPVADLLLEMTLQLVTRVNSRGHRKIGREAYLLSSIVRRMSATSADDIEESVRFLNEARIILKDNISPSEKLHVVNSIRLSVEETSTSVEKLFFLSYQSEGQNKAGANSRSNNGKAMINLALDIINNAEFLLDQAFDSATEFIAVMGHENGPIIGSILERKLLINIFSVLAILDSKALITEELVDKGRCAYEKFELHVDDNTYVKIEEEEIHSQGLKHGLLVSVVYTYARYRYGKLSIAKLSDSTFALNKVTKNLSQYNEFINKSESLVHYDRRRFKDLFTLIKVHANKALLTIISD